MDQELAKEVYDAVLDAVSDHADEVHKDSSVMSVTILGVDEVANEDEIVNVRYEVLLNSEVQLDFSKP